MKVYVDDNEDYRITYSSRDGSECLESMGMQPIIVESLKEHDKQLVNAVCEWIRAEFEDKAKYSTYFDESGYEINLTEELFLEILEKVKGEFR